MDVKYAKRGDAHLAFRAEGEGPAALEYSALTISIDARDDEPHSRRYYDRLRSFSHLVQFDARGIGLSDPLDLDELSPRSNALDGLAVLDAAGVDRAFVYAWGGSGPAAIETTVLAPERVLGLVLIGTYARLTRTDDYPIGYAAHIVEGFARDNADPDATWESPTGDDDVGLIAPSLRNDDRFRDWWTRASRRGANPYSAQARLVANVGADVRALLPRVTVPTLVIHRVDDLFVPMELGRYLADNIADARFVQLPGADNLAFSGDSGPLLDEVELFVTGSVEHGAGERVLTTVLFTDIVDSTKLAAEIGDRAWREQLDVHDAVVREQLARFGGHEVNTTGDGFLASFASPTQAVRCALAIVAASERIGTHVRAGPGCTPASANSGATTSPGSPCTSPPGSRRPPPPTDSSSPVRCETSPAAPTCGSSRRASTS